MSEGEKLIRGWKGAEKKTSKSHVQLRRDIVAGTFPAPFMLGPKSVAWYEHELDAWLASRPRRTYGGEA